MLNLNLNLGEGVRLSGPFCPERIDRTPPIFAACRLMGWENSSLARYFDLPPQTIIRWTKGERRTPEYVVYLLTEGLRPKFEGLPPTSVEKRTVWDCARAFWELSVARCAEFDSGVRDQAMDVVLQALLMAVWRRKSKNKVLIHSDQGSQFTSMDWASFLKAHNLEHSMSRRGNCHDNAVVESFFNLLKRERIRRRTYRSRAEARQDVFDYIEMFYNPKRKHVRNGMLSPVEFERQQKMKHEGV